MNLDKYKDQPNLYFIKHNVEHHEFLMHHYIYHLKILNVPKIYEYDSIQKILVMESINGENLSHNWGENASDVPTELFQKVIDIVRTLVKHQILYPDLTGYNFVQDSETYGKIWIIDFEHSSFMKSKEINNIHLLNIYNGNQIWNPDFK